MIKKIVGTFKIADFKLEGKKEQVLPFINLEISHELAYEISKKYELVEHPKDVIEPVTTFGMVVYTMSEKEYLELRHGLVKLAADLQEPDKQELLSLISKLLTPCKE